MSSSEEHAGASPSRGWPRLFEFVRSKAVGATKEQEDVGYALLYCKRQKVTDIFDDILNRMDLCAQSGFYDNSVWPQAVIKLSDLTFVLCMMSRAAAHP